MSLAVLSIVNNAFAEMRTDPLTTLLSTTDPTQLLSTNLLYAQARYLRSLRNWPQQKKTYSFTVTSGRSKYPLPEDFHAMTFDTQWDSTQSWRLSGPMGDSAFTARLYGGFTSPQIGFRVNGPDGNVLAGVGGQFEITPTPTASTEVLAFEYYSKNTFMPPNWTALETSITASPAKYRNANGLNYKCTAITTGTCGSTAPAQTSGTFVDSGVTWTTYTTPYETIIADTDLALFDDDIMIAGFKWRYLKATGLDYEVELQEHGRLVNNALGRMNGSTIGSFTRVGRLARWPRGDRDGGFLL